jgi:glutamate/tyrosine decarboxylase-like PLP-dependent enzyme
VAEQDALARALDLARGYVASRADRPVWATATLRELRAALGGPLPATPIDPTDVIDALARAAEPGLVTTTGPRYFGFVTGGALPATVAAEWLTAVWDQPASLYVLSPAAAVVEEVAGAWLIDLLGLPASCSVGFVTGCHMANFTALAAARHELLRRTGWDLEAEGLQGAPRLRVIVGDEVHVSVVGALRMLGIGSRQIVRVAADDQGRMRPDALEAAFSGDGNVAQSSSTHGVVHSSSELNVAKGSSELDVPKGFSGPNVAQGFSPANTPTIVCAQAGNVNTGAFDPLDAIADVASRHQAWLHVDGAFGLWAAASDALKHHVRGIERADSCATDAHKWLNVPYDSGLVFVAHPAAHRAATSLNAAYLVRSPDEPREPMDWVPESSRRARGFAVYAALRSLGRSGVADLVDRCCRLAQRFADRLRREPSLRILNEVVLNQVLVRVVPPAGDADVATREALRIVQEERVCWLGGSRWHDMDAMRISVSNWSTTEEDIDRSADSIVRAARRQA